MRIYLHRLVSERTDAADLKFHFKFQLTHQFGTTHGPIDTMDYDTSVVASTVDRAMTLAYDQAVSVAEAWEGKNRAANATFTK